MIIGIAGKMQCGKTVTASYLADLCGGQRISFADALREEVSEKYRIPIEHMRSAELKRSLMVLCGFAFMTLRELLQWWGEDRRSANRDYWVDALMATITDDGIYIIDDVRYRNEAQRIRDTGGILVRIEPYTGYPINPGAYHRSETDLDDWGDWDYVAHPEFGTGELTRLAVYLAERFGLA